MLVLGEPMLRFANALVAGGVAEAFGLEAPTGCYRSFQYRGRRRPCAMATIWMAVSTSRYTTEKGNL